MLACACWVAFVVVLAVAYWVPSVRGADGWAVTGFVNLQWSWFDVLAERVAALANPVPFALWTVLLASSALYQRRPRHALAVVLLLIAANVLAQALKQLLAYERWHDALGHAQISAASFPSGHATASMTLAFAAVIVAPVAWRRWVAIAGAVFTLAVSESVMLLAWHYPSDVVGGFLVATACTLLTVAALRAADERWPERSGRDAARRAIQGIDVVHAGAFVVAFMAGVLAIVAVAVAAATHHGSFAAEHTTTLAAAMAVGALCALLPVSVAAFGTRQL